MANEHPTYYLARLKEVEMRARTSEKFNLLNDEFWSKLWYAFFTYPLLKMRKINGKKHPTVLKFDVWEESSMHISKIRHLPFLVKKIFNPREIFFIDIDRNLLKLAKKNIENFGFNKSFLFNGTIENMPFKKDFFDLVIDFSTIDHLNDVETQKTIKEIRRVLKAGGLVIIYHLNSEYFNIEKWNDVYKEGKFPSFHRKLKTISYLLKEDFEIVDFKYCFPFFADSTLMIFYRMLYDKIYKLLPRRLFFSYFNSPRLNMFYYIIAKKV